MIILDKDIDKFYKDVKKVMNICHCDMDKAIEMVKAMWISASLEMIWRDRGM